MFMAPEQALGHQIDQRADLFSLGSVLYQMASGRPPFRAPSALAVLKRVAEEPPRPIPEIIPETPDWLCGIIAKLHAKNPDDRFQSAREVADLLADCEAKLKAKQEVKNVLPAASRVSGRVEPAGRKWVAAAAVLLLPVIALAVTEFAGVTHLFRPPPILDTIRPGIKSPADAPDGGDRWPAGAPKPAIAPFDAVKAKEYQEAWAKYLDVPVQYTNSIGMTFVLIPPGEFIMGTAPEEISEKLALLAHESKLWHDSTGSEGPRHRVVLKRPIYLGIYEVTQAQYEQVMGVNPSEFSPQGPAKRPSSGANTNRHPVENVSWNEAAEFCVKLSEREKLTPFKDQSARANPEAQWHGLSSPDGSRMGIRLPRGDDHEVLQRRHEEGSDANRSGQFQGEKPNASGRRTAGQSVRTSRHARQRL